MTNISSLPRELAPGVFWLGDCLEQPFKGKIYHAYNAAFLVIGSKSSYWLRQVTQKIFL